MATESDVVIKTFPANADLTGSQYYIVVLNSGGSVALATAVTDQPIGILQNKPNTGEAASVAVAGFSKIVTGSALSIDNEVASDSAGKGTTITVAAAGTVYNYAIGRMTQATAGAAEIGQCLIYPGGMPFLV